MGGGDGQGLDKVLLLQVLGVDPPAAPALGAVGVHGHPLDVAVAAEGKGAGFLLNQVFDVDFVLDVLNLGLPLVAELVPNLNQLLTKQGFQLVFVRQQLQIVLDFLHQIIVFRLELLPVKTLKSF